MSYLPVIGDVVLLKSGSVEITVIEVDDENDTIICCYYAENAENAEEFKKITLPFLAVGKSESEEDDKPDKESEYPDDPE
jgi:uncharacterized protein YodC (DUF2158 family)